MHITPYFNVDLPILILVIKLYRSCNFTFFKNNTNQDQNISLTITTMIHLISLTNCLLRIPLHSNIQLFVDTKFYFVQKVFLFSIIFSTNLILLVMNNRLKTRETKFNSIGKGTTTTTKKTLYLNTRKSDFVEKFFRDSSFCSYFTIKAYFNHNTHPSN